MSISINTEEMMNRKDWEIVLVLQKMGKHSNNKDLRTISKLSELTNRGISKTVSVNIVAEQFNCSPSYIYKLVHRGMNN